MSEAVITLHGLTKRFAGMDKPAVAPLDCTIHSGYVTGLVGPDGAGKTTLMRMLAGLLKADDGSASVLGFDPIQNDSELHAVLGYMPQKFGLYEDLTVMENLTLYADLRSVTGEIREKTFARLLAFTALGPFTGRLAGKLSGGMKQKLGLACTLVGEPKVLLLDEPGVGVDPISRRELWQMVHELAGDGMLILWSTSYLDEAEQCRDVLLMNEGELLYQGEPKALTQTMAGRSFLASSPQENNRKLLQRALRLPQVSDGMIQGRSVRLILKKEATADEIRQADGMPEIILNETAPRFEDAFIDLLGGAGTSESPLGAILHTVEGTPGETVIEAKELTKKFGDFAATDHVNFVVQRGEIFGLLGPNGAGKSTTFKMMCGLLVPTSGKALVLDMDLKVSSGKARQHLGYMAQKFSLYGNLTVEQNLRFFSGVYGLRGRAQNEKIQRMSEAFGLKSIASHPTDALPLGFKQRLALACSLMHEPDILFLDEPTSGVDPLTRREFWLHINSMVEKGVTVMVTTHFMDEAEYCDRIGLVYRGKLIASGTPDDLKAQPPMRSRPIRQWNRLLSPSSMTGIRSIRMSKSLSWRRVRALCVKETRQIVRDPSSWLIAVVIPLLLLFIFGYGINLDSSKLRVGILLEQQSQEALDFTHAMTGSPYIDATISDNRHELIEKMQAGRIRGLVVIPVDFAQQMARTNDTAPIQVITDGSEPNTANFVQGYVEGIWQIWQMQRAEDRGDTFEPLIDVQTRYWFNPAAISQHFIIPGAVTIIMTVIGAILTSLVVAREWERGTMEALLSTEVTRIELLLCKLIPYYFLGMLAMLLCMLVSVFILGVPYRGSLLILFVITSLFLLSTLGMGLLISTITRNQFNAAQVALNAAFLPSIMLSGFIFQIDSMPAVIRAVTYIIPARYFVSTLQSLFLAGNIPVVLGINVLFLIASAVMFIGLTWLKTKRRLD